MCNDHQVIKLESFVRDKICEYHYQNKVQRKKESPIVKEMLLSIEEGWGVVYFVYACQCAERDSRRQGHSFAMQLNVAGEDLRR